ncbi:MAG: hypothetical protein PF689_11860, partial [Deltaproteobacteria bacterium]|nr:hypothetical protein [Deltaproteobacteria bacterium]
MSVENTNFKQLLEKYNFEFDNSHDLLALSENPPQYDQNREVAEFIHPQRWRQFLLSTSINYAVVIVEFLPRDTVLALRLDPFQTERKYSFLPDEFKKSLYFYFLKEMGIPPLQGEFSRDNLYRCGQLLLSPDIKLPHQVHEGLELFRASFSRVNSREIAAAASLGNFVDNPDRSCAAN